MLGRDLAKGKYFCNRTEEKKILFNNIKNHIHTVISSPRRFGKTSLVFKVLDENNISYAYVDLYSVESKKEVLTRFLSSISTVISSVSNFNEVLIKKAASFFISLRPSINIGKNISLKFDAVTNNEDIYECLQKTFLSLEKFLEKKDLKIVFFVDEFQAITDVNESAIIEAVLRTFAQKTNNITFIFSGSNRHLLNQIFSDSKRPFFNLCKPIFLKPIKSNKYLPFLKSLNPKISNELLTHILNLTYCGGSLDNSYVHPYYVNSLYSELKYFYSNHANKKDNNISLEQTLWDNMIDEQTPFIEQTLKMLSLSQRKILNYMARAEHMNLKSYGIGIEHKKLDKIKYTSKETLQKIDISASGMIKSLKSLEKKDLVWKDKGKYYIVPPIMRGYLVASGRGSPLTFPIQLQ